MNKIINMYYKEFESYGRFWRLSNPLLICFLVSMFLFFIFLLNVFDLFDLHGKYKWLKSLSQYFVFIAEVFTLLFFRELENQRDKYLVKKYEEKYHKKLHLREIKKKWFESTIDIPLYEYASLAEKIDKYYMLEEKYAKPSLTRDKFIGYIFSSDSKNRVLAMFMGLVALFMGLNVASGSNIENLYAIYNSLDFLEAFFWIFFISLIIFLFAYMIRFSLSMAFNFLDFVFDNAASTNRISKRKKEIFIAELIKFHELPKKRHRVYF